MRFNAATYLRAGLLSVVVAMASPAAFAATQSDLSLEDIRAQQAELREAAITGRGVFEDMQTSTRTEMFSRQEEVLAMIEGKQSVDQLTPNQRTELFNSLEWIEAAINQAEDARIKCKRERKLGSNRKVRICKSVAQWEYERQQAREALSSPSSRFKETDGG